MYTLKAIYDKIPAIDASTILQGTTYLGVAGNIVNCSSEGGNACYANSGYWTATAGDNVSGANGSLSFSISNGFYSGKTATASDTNLIAGNIASNISIFGVSGALNKNQYNGSASTGDYPISTGGVDDYNANGTMPADSYKSSWSALCHAGTVPNDTGNNWCGTNDANAYVKDSATGIVWSIWMGNGTTYSWFYANNCKYPNGLGDNGVCDSDGKAACKCVKHTGGADPKTGCEALGDLGWRLPSQKELMQGYIDGARGKLSSAGHYFWTSTTRSDATQQAWWLYLYSGSVYAEAKVTDYMNTVRCVR